MQYFIFVLEILGMMSSVDHFAAHSLADEVDEYSAIQSFDENIDWFINSCKRNCGVTIIYSVLLSSTK